MKNTKAFLVMMIFVPSFVFAQSFSELCFGETTNGTVVNFERYKDTIYATGFFNTICNEPTKFVAQWEDGNWSASSIELSDPGHALRVIDDYLYIAKYEQSIDSNWVWRYDGNALEKLGAGVYLTTASGLSKLPNIYDIIQYEDRIIACGEFDRVGQESIQGIMQWNGNAWEAMNGGLSGNIQNTANVMFPHQLFVHDSELYVVGNFRYAGGVEVNGIAKWNGSEWTAMGAGFNNTVYSIIAFNGELIVGGSFTESNGQSLNRLAKWNGSEWTSLGFGFTNTSVNDFSFVHTMKEIDGTLYLAGGLKQITYDDNSTLACGGIVAYTGQSIQNFNGGISGNDIEAIIQTEEQELLIGGGVFGNGYLGQLEAATNTEMKTFSEDIDVYPNPFNDKLFIETTLKLKHYALVDSYGRIIKPAEINQQVLDLTAIETGIYFLILTTKKGTHRYKLLKH